jgi:hypothetical protein
LKLHLNWARLIAVLQFKEGPRLSTIPSGSFVPFTQANRCFTNTAMRIAKKNLIQNVQDALLHSSRYRMNEQDRQDLWMELFAVTVRYEERRGAALQANLGACKGEQGSSEHIADLAKNKSQNLFQTVDHE